MLESQRDFGDFEIFPFPDEFFQNAPSALLSQFVRKVSKSAEAALNKLSKYFDSETGIHPAIRFLQDVRFFNPVTSLEFEEKPDLTIPGFNDIPAGELLLYREKARKFTFGKINDSSTKVKQLEEKIMCLRDFWLANEEVLPTLSALVLCYGSCFQHLLTLNVHFPSTTACSQMTENHSQTSLSRKFCSCFIT